MVSQRRPGDAQAQAPVAGSQASAEQRAGRALLWDKAVDRQVWADYQAGRVAQKPYVYQTKA